MGETHGNPFLDSKVGGKTSDPSEVHPGGGVAGKVEYRMDLLDPTAILVIANIMHEGVKTHPDAGNWKRLPVNVHVNHALTHIMMYMAGSVTEDHLGRALTRLMMAVGIERSKPPAWIAKADLSTEEMEKILNEPAVMRRIDDKEVT